MTFSVGDLVILKSGSMRMVVEAVDEGGVVETVWCNDGVIGRDRFASVLLNKAEERGERPQHGGFRGHRDDRGDRDDRGPRGGHRDDRAGRDDRGPRGGRDDRWAGRDDRGHGGQGGHGGHNGHDRDDRPRRTGWDGKPREKKYFRKDA